MYEFSWYYELVIKYLCNAGFEEFFLLFITANCKRCRSKFFAAELQR